MNMKTRQSRRQTAKVSHSRWLAYATAGAATALAGSHSLEAAIHYSGILRVHFPPDRTKYKTFPLDQTGDSIRFVHRSGNFAGVFITAILWPGSVRGFPTYHGGTWQYYASKLPFGQNISSGPFRPALYYDAALAGNYSNSQWGDRGTGFVGFRFNSGAGIQYGWARVRMVGDPEHAFTVLDYAYADPGEPIRAGQTSSAGDMVDTVTDSGSVGLLALGAAGLLAWRKRRSRKL
jgi:MYXO-CTERM domain-containing protein